MVVTHNGRDRALATLASCLAGTGGAALEWIVVDSGSSDGTPDAIEGRYPDVRVLRRPNLGFAAGVNAALPSAHGRYLLLVNPDLELRRGTLADVVAALDARPEVGAASVTQVGPGGSVQPSIRRFPSPARQLAQALGLHRVRSLARVQEADVDYAAYERERSVDWLVGAFLALRREALDAVGPFDERFFLFCEETDVCLRLRRSGWDIRHLPEFAVLHHGGDYRRPDIAAHLVRSKARYAAKHFGPLGRASMRGALLLQTGLRLAARPRAQAERAAFMAALEAVPRELRKKRGSRGVPFATSPDTWKRT